jgi:hypothetical protein
VMLKSGLALVRRVVTFCTTRIARAATACWRPDRDKGERVPHAQA